jgi:pyruvate kinase
MDTTSRTNPQPRTGKNDKKTIRRDDRRAPRSPGHGDLFDDLIALRDGIHRDAEEILARWRPGLKRPAFAPSAENLAAYLAFRRRDVRPFQDDLASWGLSSLGRSEGHVMANLDAVLSCLAVLTGRNGARVPARPRPDSFKLGGRLLDHNTRQLFGAPEGERLTHIMVTLPEEAETDTAFVQALVARGMSCARINCAHGTHESWRAMIRHVRDAEARLGRGCRVLMDLCGPRARTLAVCSREDRRILAGDHLLLRPTPPDAGDAGAPFQAQCTPGSIIQHLTVGTTVLIDEGSLEAHVEALGDTGALARVTRTPPSGARLKAEKGLNFPGTELGIPALTDKDRADLDVVIENADMIGYSFVQDRTDVEALWREIEPRLAGGRARQRPPGLILKIETEQAVRRLPELIIATAGLMPTGVMIARGDLAVEVGFQRLAELQEEILWLAEAAHTPVIWATQVLDHLVKKGTPSRAEISDVVLAQRAECVMLNKGEFLLDALTIVDDIFRRMDAHQHKKTSRLRALRAWS